jgi:HAD superfamily hydrolase (TIGR01548 family)
MKSHPEVIIFDVDGVLVDVRGSFHRTVIETVRFFTGRRVTRAELHHWKSKSGFNDDWKLSTAWIHSLGGNAPYEEVKSKFVQLYWGHNSDGNVLREKWLLPRSALRRLAARSKLALFTGRVRQETDYTLDRLRVREFFWQIVTAEDVQNLKPHPEGLLAILKGCDPARALYLGDNIDDALAARAAHVAFVGVLPQSRQAIGARREMFLKLEAAGILKDIRQLEQWLRRGGFQGAGRSASPRE